MSVDKADPVESTDNVEPGGGPSDEGKNEEAVKNNDDFEMCANAIKFAEKKVADLKDCARQLRYWSLKPLQVLCDIPDCY